MPPDARLRTSWSFCSRLGPMLVTYAYLSPFVVLGLAVGGSLALIGALGCADPCLDDGLGQKSCPSAQEAGGTADDNTAEGMEAEVGSADGNDAETGDTMSSGDGDGDGDEGGDGDGDGEVPPSCFNGMQDGDETDIDCGGSCLDTCLDGGTCLVDEDCINGPCNMGVCKDPVCDPDESNGCQGCLQQQCCDNMIACFEDPDCVCWFECISHNNDFAPCQDACNIGNIGPITSCANSKCGDLGACGV